MWYVTLAVLFVAYAFFAAMLERLHVTGPMLFLGLGIASGLLHMPNPLGNATSRSSLALMTLTLSLLLFADASTIRLEQLREDASAPARLLLLALPLAVLAGLLGARSLLPLPVAGVGMAALIGVILAPTDVSLGLAMFSNERVPARVRRAINVESGLNDGLAAPLVAIAVGVVIAETENLQTPIIDAASEVLLGVLAGVAVGLAGGALLRLSQRASWSSRTSRVFASFGLAVAAYVAALAVHGNGFVAAFVGGLAFGAIARDTAEETVSFAEEGGTLLSLGVWYMFGTAIGPHLAESGMQWQPVLYAVLSLTLFRMLPVVLSLARAEDFGAVRLRSWAGSGRAVWRAASSCSTPSSN